MAILSGVSDVKPEAKESPNKQDTQVALLLRNAFTYRAATNKTVMVIANGHVTLTPVADIDVAMQFTVGQWNEIVEFVDTQLLQAFEDEQGWQVDWAAIPTEYKYVAVDEDGRAFAYLEQPHTDDDIWIAKGDCFRIEGADFPDIADWRKSVIRRPGV